MSVSFGNRDRMNCWVKVAIPRADKDHMSQKTNDPSDAKTRPEAGFRPPRAWRRGDVLLASLAINLLALALPVVILQVYDRIVPNQAWETFSLLLAAMIVVVALDVALKLMRSAILAREAARFEHRNALEAMTRILEADAMAFRSHPSGYYLDRMRAMEQAQEFYSGQSQLLAIDFPFVVLYLALVFVIAGPLAWVPLLLLGLFLGVSLISARRLHRALEEKSRMEDRRQNFLIEILRGIHTVKAMAMEPFMMRRNERLQEQSASGIHELSRINAIAQGIGATFSQMASAAFVAIGALFVIEGQLSIGALAAGTMLSTRVLRPGLRAMNLWIQFQSVRLATRHADELLRLPREVGGRYAPQDDIEGEIELREVYFRYPGQQRDLLDRVSLHIDAGEAIAISGDNGAGKSTTIDLLSAYLTPDRGEILLDGRRLQDYDPAVLRSQVGIVPQRGILFEGTILENMTLFREGTAVDEALDLARRLGLGELIAMLPDGLDTRVGGAAVDTLPDGVRQQIVLIRSLIGGPRVILFDDANANFDIRNDSRLLRLFTEMKGERTMIIVSHRPSFQRLCDRHFELRDGRLHEYRAASPIHPNPLKVADGS